MSENQTSVALLHGELLLPDEGPWLLLPDGACSWFIDIGQFVDNSLGRERSRGTQFICSIILYY